jgi:hypothetical protein
MENNKLKLNAAEEKSSFLHNVKVVAPPPLKSD